MYSNDNGHESIHLKSSHFEFISIWIVYDEYVLMFFLLLLLCVYCENYKIMRQ